MIPALRFSTRALLISFLPVFVALTGGFLAVRAVVETRVRSGLRDSLQKSERALETVRGEYDRRNRRLVAILSENAGLKAGIGLLREREPSARDEIRRTLEDQLRELAGTLEYDLLAVADGQGHTVAATMRSGSVHLSLPLAISAPASASLVEVQGVLYDVTTVPINLGAEHLGNLTVGKAFDIHSVSSPGYVALLRNGKVARTSLAVEALPELEQQLAQGDRATAPESEIELGGETYLVSVLNRPGFGEGYRLLGLQSIDVAVGRFLLDVRFVFTWVGACAMVVVLILSVVGSRSAARPLTSFVELLRESESAGQLRKDFPTDSAIREVNQLARAFNRAAGAILEWQQRLEQAYLQFIETMAQALDARDPYTAGHSERVSEYATVIAQAMHLPEDQIEIIRVGARFHDIGKIGVPDAVLQKPGRLTEAERAMIKEHPQIGKRILEKVGRFREFLPCVELHHENHDGRGYPYGLIGEQTPLVARIVKVADAYDAMMTDRAYRKAIPRDRVIEELKQYAGTQFDPRVVDVFLTILETRESAPAKEYAGA